ncbi:hypothetical protein TH66_19540 [Carbonactinospora thermoautotrophica]|uniref:Uncharacterized protein n=1 Tax=Carbonactinospora thermoautotrophica TaxID=1469144 RepID=A0A132MIP2_9ACTN|nr:hypothetical protein TH66_19540 [Carbonactinospora thermoautotrophica]
MPGPSFTGLPNPILKPHRTHTISTTENALNTISMVFTTHFRGTSPPYRSATPGMLIRPTSVAAISCHALSPGLTQLG